MENSTYLNWRYCQSSNWKKDCELPPVNHEYAIIVFNLYYPDSQVDVGGTGGWTGIFKTSCGPRDANIVSEEIRGESIEWTKVWFHLVINRPTSERCLKEKFLKSWRHDIGIVDVENPTWSGLGKGLAGRNVTWYSVLLRQRDDIVLGERLVKCNGKEDIFSLFRNER